MSKRAVEDGEAEGINSIINYKDVKVKSSNGLI